MPRGKGTGLNTAARIVRTIWQNPRISRVGIAERLGFDKSTVTNQVARLIDLGIIEEIAEGEVGTKGGRRPIHLAMDRSFGRVMGIEIQLESYVAVAVDLAGEILAEKRGAADLSPGKLVDEMPGVIHECVAGLCPEGVRLLGIGVGVGGLVDVKKSRIRYSVPLGIDAPIDFGRAIATRFPVPCHVENDANCCAWGELVFNRDEALKDFLFALVESRTDERSLMASCGTGVGFGFVLGGKVYSGAHGDAGEFRSVFCEGAGEAQFSREATVGRALGGMGEELARNVAMLVNTMDFDHVFIGGDIETLDPDFPDILRRRLEENWMYPMRKSVQIRFSSLGSKAVAYGAAGMVLDRLISGKGLPGLGSDESPMER